jgi:carbon-monoxide dehydrogenase iron sulfur subunit
VEKILITNPDECTGCRICELVCSITKHGEFNPKKSYIHILRNKDMDINIITLGLGCDQCEECIKWCMPEAIEFVDVNDAVEKWKAVKIGRIPASLV